MKHDMTLAMSIAESLETRPAFLPFMPELLADLWALGADPERVVRLLSPLLPSGADVLDLACGKGAVSVTLAARLGCRALGLDGMPAFIDSARAMATSHGVGHLCRFETCDIRTYQPGSEQFDAVILSSTGPILGALRETVGVLRRMVKPGGFIVLDDAWRMETGLPLPPLAASYPTCNEAHAALTAYGDEIVAEEVIPVESVRVENVRNNGHIQKRVDALAQRYPDCAASFCAYASHQLYECYLLENIYQCALWVIKVSVPAHGNEKAAMKI